MEDVKMNSEDETFDKFIEVDSDYCDEYQFEHNNDNSDKENANSSVKKIQTKPEQIQKIIAFVKGMQKSQ